MKYAILTPTRNRRDRLYDFISSVFEHVSDFEKVHCFNYIDSDDPALGDYKVMNDTYYRFMTTVVGEPQSVSKSWNVLADLAIRKKFDVLIMGNDDLIYRTKNWDKILDRELKQYPDEIYCAYMNDMINGPKHCAFPIVSKKWYETLGYFTPGIFHFGYNDTWVFDIANKIGRAHYINNIVADHVHGPSGKAPMDDTYARNRTQEAGNLFQKDKVIFDNTEIERQEDANKLKAVMNG